MSTLKASPKTSFARWFALLGLTLLPMQSMAQENPGDETMGQRLTSFFSAMEGDWDGEGTVQLLQNDGSIRQHEFSIELDFDDDSQENSWRARTETTYDTGLWEVQSSYFSVRNDLLFAGDQFNKEPILVEEITPERLIYSFDRIVYPARLHFTFTLDRIGEDTLRVHSVVRRNGVKIEERVWTVGR